MVVQPRGGSPFGAHRVVSPPGVLPQAAWRLDASPTLWPDEVRIEVERLNLDAASFRQLSEQHGADGEAVRAAVAALIAERGKMHNPVTGSGGMLIGTVAEVGPASPLGLRVGQRVASLVSLTLTPLELHGGIAGLDGWDGRGEQVPASGHAILFGRSIAAPLPSDLPDELALGVLDVCGAPALVARVLGSDAYRRPRVTVLGAAGKSGLLTLAAARRSPGALLCGVVRDAAEQARLAASGLADEVVVADACDPLGLHDRLAGREADVVVVCVDAPGAEHGAILATRPGGTVIFFSMATSFTAAALGAEGLAADLTLLVGTGYTPGHAELALGLVRSSAELRAALEDRLNLRSKVELSRGWVAG